jgi:hypothetical protein
MKGRIYTWIFCLLFVQNSRLSVPPSSTTRCGGVRPALGSPTSIMSGGSIKSAAGSRKLFHVQRSIFNIQSLSPVRIRNSSQSSNLLVLAPAGPVATIRLRDGSLGRLVNLYWGRWVPQFGRELRWIDGLFEGSEHHFERGTGGGSFSGSPKRRLISIFILFSSTQCPVLHEEFSRTRERRHLQATL